MNRHALIRAALDALSFCGRARAGCRRAPDAAGFVVTLHHVAPARAASFDPNALLSITPDFLDRFIGHFIQRGWRFVSVDELVAGGERADPRRIAITLDDGYRDNLEHAWPVFRKHARALHDLSSAPASRSAQRSSGGRRWSGSSARPIRFGCRARGRRRCGRRARRRRSCTMFRRVARMADDASPTRRSSGSRSARSPRSTASTSRRWRGELVMDWDEIRAHRRRSALHDRRAHDDASGAGAAAARGGFARDRRRAPSGSRRRSASGRRRSPFPTAIRLPPGRARRSSRSRRALPRPSRRSRATSPRPGRATACRACRSTASSRTSAIWKCCSRRASGS